MFCVIACIEIQKPLHVLDLRKLVNFVFILKLIRNVNEVIRGFGQSQIFLERFRKDQTLTFG